MEYKHLLVRRETGETIKRAARGRGMTIVDYVDYLMGLDGVSKGELIEEIPLTDEERERWTALEDKNGTTTIGIDRKTSLLLDFLVSDARMQTTKSIAVRSLVIEKLKKWGVIT